MTVSAIINLLAALFKAIPSIRELVEVACEASRSTNVAEAVKRWKEKNAKVKEALQHASLQSKACGKHKPQGGLPEGREQRGFCEAKPSERVQHASKKGDGTNA